MKYIKYKGELYRAIDARVFKSKVEALNAIQKNLTKLNVSFTRIGDAFFFERKNISKDVYSKLVKFAHSSSGINIEGNEYIHMYYA